jgi:hypothetical protein
VVQLEVHATEKAWQHVVSPTPAARAVLTCRCMPSARPAACAKNPQFIGKNRQLMRISDNSGHQRAVSGVAEADVASLFSEARGWSPVGFGGQRVRALAENASLSSEATARCSSQGEGVTDHGALLLGALSWAWRYHHRESESGIGLAQAG